MRFSVVLVCIGLAVPAAAQNSPPAPPYEAALLRLSELMGALHYLRGLCGAPEVDAWRDKMAALIASGGGDTTKRDRLAGAFNRGYRTFEQSYRTCNISAQETIRAYLAEGARIASDLTARYGQ